MSVEALVYWWGSLFNPASALEGIGALIILIVLEVIAIFAITIGGSVWYDKANPGAGMASLAMAIFLGYGSIALFVIFDLVVLGAMLF
jgi:hypothetical protein